MTSLLTRSGAWRAFWLSFIVLNAFGLWAVSATADLDQAEQLVFSQAWQFGYSAQPPLYTWLVAGLFAFTGPHLGALLLLKAALVVAAAFSPTYRVLLRGPWPWVAALVATAVLAPHLAWVAEHAGIAAGIEGKLNQADAAAWAGLGAVLVKAIAFLTPLWLFALPWIWRAARARAWPDSPAWRFLALLFLAVLGVMVGFVLASGADRIRDRWYMPLLPFVPVLVAALAPARPPRALLVTGAGLMLVAATVLPLRTLMVDSTARPVSVNVPYAAHFKAIADATGMPVLIYAENKFIGGNARLWFPEARVVTPEFDRSSEPAGGPTWMLCEAQGCGANFRTWLAERRGIDPESLMWSVSRQPYVGSAQHRHSLWWSQPKRPKAPS